MNLVFSLNKPQPVNPANNDSGPVAGKVAEIVVKQEDAERLKDGFIIAVRHCGLRATQ